MKVLTQALQVLTLPESIGKKCLEGDAEMVALFEQVWWFHIDSHILQKRDRALKCVEDLLLYQSILREVPAEYVTLNRCYEWKKWIATLIAQPTRENFAALYRFLKADTTQDVTHLQMKQQLEVEIAQKSQEILSLEQSLAEVPNGVKLTQEIRQEIETVATCATEEEIVVLESSLLMPVSSLQQQTQEIEKISDMMTLYDELGLLTEKVSLLLSLLHDKVHAMESCHEVISLITPLLGSHHVVESVKEFVSNFASVLLPDIFKELRSGSTRYSVFQLHHSSDILQRL